MSDDHDEAEPSEQDWIADCLAYLVHRLSQEGIWYSLAYGTLLGALRERDIIAWDYDFDLLIRPSELPRIFALGGRLAEDGFSFRPTRHTASALALNPAGVTEFATAAIGVFHQGFKVGDLYAFSVFADGVMRRWDFERDVYWCPHSSFPAWFVEGEAKVELRGKTYSAVRSPEKWIAGIYGEDWRVPYRAAKQGGALRDGVTVHGDRYEPKLHAEIAWCEAQGWDRSVYANAPAWPRLVGGAGPIGPTPRTERNSRSLWWRDLDELQAHF